MDQVEINSEWHRGAQFHQGKWASNTIWFAMLPLLLQMVKIDSPFHCNKHWNYFGICLQCLNNGWINWKSILSGIVAPNFTKGNGPVIRSRLPSSPLLLQTVKIDSLFHCNRLGIILEFVCNASTRDGSSGHQF